MKIATMCKFCNQPLAIKPTAWASKDGMYCSEQCGIEDAKALYRKSEYTGEIDLSIKARAYFKDNAEEISREDYGASAEYVSVYSSSHDITTIFEQTYENDDEVSMTIVGWHFGEPNSEAQEDAIRAGLTALFI